MCFMDGGTEAQASLRELRPATPSVWLGPAAALVIGLPVLAWGLLASGQTRITWFVPVCDAVAVLCMLVVLLLGVLDAGLLNNRRSLPIGAIAVATSVMWIGHFIIFPGDIPALGGNLLNQATPILFLLINLLTPLMLSIALLQRDRELRRTRRAVAIAMCAGLAVGLATVGASFLIGSRLETVSAAGEFSTVDAVVGVAGLVPAGVGMIVFAAGLRGDERVAGGALAALTFTGLTSISLLFLQARYTPSWFADHILATGAFVALLAGQLWLYGTSVIAERQAAAAVAMAAERRRIGLDIAEAMAVETDYLPVVNRLVSGVREALEADRVTMLRLVPEGFVVECSIDRDREPASIGTHLTVDSVVSGDRRVLVEAIETREPVLTDGYRVIGLDPENGDSHAGIRRSILLPLVRGGEAYGVLIGGRRSDRPFTPEDADQLRELGALAALLIRNARLLAETELASQAKSNFINLAAHELGTPISVIRGYIEMLADGAFGALGTTQVEPVATIQTSTAELAARVAQLLSAARLEVPSTAGQPVETVDLVSLARDAARSAGQRARLIGGSITVVAPDRPVEAVAQARDVGIILDNLVNNALTYSRPPATIRIEVTDGQLPEVRVKDNGIGIPDDARERVFDQFYRVDNVDFGYPSGTGLGLFISRRLAEQYGGRLYVESSSPDGGTVFTLRLKRATS